MTAKRARLSILNEVLSFPAIHGKDWISDWNEIPREGDLVALNCAPATKWYLSWVHEYDPGDGWPKYLLESIEDGELCWWSNVGINIYDRKKSLRTPVMALG